MIDDERTRAVTNTGFRLSEQLELSFCDAGAVDIIVSFVKHSGIAMMRPSLIRLLDNGVGVRILTSTYLGITDPFALRMLFDLRIKVRTYVYSTWMVVRSTPNRTSSIIRTEPRRCS